MKDILIVSNEDTCRSRMAQELLASFGRGMTIFTAGASGGHFIPEVVERVMAEQGHEISRKKPVSVELYAGQHWDVVLTLCPEAEDGVSCLNLKGDYIRHFDFPDVLSHRRDREDEQEKKLLELYQNMYRELYRFYRDVLSDLLMPSCTCGANTYCRCE